MTDMLWFVLLTSIAIEPVTIDERQFIAGDVVSSSLVAAGENEAKCQAGGRVLAQTLRDVSGGRIEVVLNCIEMPATVGLAQGMTDIGREQDE